jgi:SAM-dependent methyltransferase
VEPDQVREASRARWDEAAAGWARRQTQMREATASVSGWLVEAIRPQPGHRVLEVAAGQGETGFLAAEAVLPGGTLISSDRSEGMLESARARAEELGLDNVEFRALDAERLDLPTADLDAVLCRWGVMLLVDRGAALQEMRRVLRPGGRLALAVWGPPETNQWAAIPARTLMDRGLVPAPEPGSPGMFELADEAVLHDLIAGAGFTDVEIEPIDFEYAHPSFDDWWETHVDLSAVSAEAVAGLSSEEDEALRADLRARLENFFGEDGSLVLPARALGAAASA